MIEQISLVSVHLICYETNFYYIYIHCIPNFSYNPKYNVLEIYVSKNRFHSYSNLSDKEMVIIVIL